ncbi:MAG: restriction endonuclease subunit S [Acidaminococcaceae bacterium]|nr:restriction endonuclease subunit S [Acidaminococcaceae bacterium]
MKVKLGDVCERASSNIMQKDIKLNSGKYPIYGASGYISSVDFYHQDKQYIAVVKDGAGVGRTMLLPPKSSVIGTLQYLLPKDNVLPQYLYYVVTYMRLDRYYTGATIPHIYFRDYREEEFNLSSKDEQQKIVSVLDKLQSIISLRKEQLAKLDELVKARFVEMFGDKHNSIKYPYVSIKDLTNVCSGGTPSRNIPSYWENGTIPWVKTTELKNNVIIDIEEFITEKGLNNSSAKIVPPGTILIAMYGQGKTRGMTGYLGVQATTNQACACILPTDNINAMYLWQYLMMSYDDLRDLAKGGNQPNLNGDMIKNYQVLLPPLKLQNQFADFVQQVDKSKVAVQKALDKTQLLFDSLMQEYFG